MDSFYFFFSLFQKLLFYLSKDSRPKKVASTPIVASQISSSFSMVASNGALCHVVFWISCKLLCLDLQQLIIIYFPFSSCLKSVMDATAVTCLSSNYCTFLGTIFLPIFSCNLQYYVNYGNQICPQKCIFNSNLFYIQTNITFPQISP